jgi:hypothetical protein
MTAHVGLREDPMRKILLLVFALTALTASPVSAGSVDPSTLQPPPPPGARCHSAGNQVICDTTLNFEIISEPAFDAPCGTLYMTGTDLRDGTRWYTDGLITHRHVVGALNATLSLSPTGEGPTIRATGHWNWWSVWAVPGGNDDDAVTTESGLDLRLSGPGLGSGFHISGRFLPDGTTHVLFTAFTDEAFAAVCAALGA